MTKSSNVPAPRPAETSPGDARARLEQLYRAIGISAVAAAAAQVARGAPAPEKPKHDLPPCLRDDGEDVAA